MGGITHPIAGYKEVSHAKLNYTLALGHVKKSEVRRQLEAMQDLITNILMDLRWGDLSDG